jgi:hypothetical protein
MKNMLNRKNKFLIIIAVFLLSVIAVKASTTNGSIDSSYYTAQVCEDVTCAVSSTSPVNFGKFTTLSNYNVAITDNALTGYMWGKKFGWVALNCADAGGCSSANGNFKVVPSSAGVLSGYAYGESAGWVNFGPFSNSSTAQVTINSAGQFNGYAWSQNYGWIKFDCTVSGYCVKTDWAASQYRSAPPFISSLPVVNNTKPVVGTILPDEPTEPQPKAPQPKTPPRITKITTSPTDFTSSNTGDGNTSEPSYNNDSAREGIVQEFFNKVYTKIEEILPNRQNNSNTEIETGTETESGNASPFQKPEAVKLVKTTSRIGFVAGVIVSIAFGMFNPLTITGMSVISTGSQISAFLYGFVAFILSAFGVKRRKKEVFDQNGFITKPVNTKRDILIARVLTVLFVIGFIFTVIAVSITPSIYNKIMLGLYIVLFINNIYKNYIKN